MVEKNSSNLSSVVGSHLSNPNKLESYDFIIIIVVWKFQLKLVTISPIILISNHNLHWPDGMLPEIYTVGFDQ